MAFEIATRRALPVHIAITGKTGSGKTLGALKLARGLVGPKGVICGICTERGRMSLYANDVEVGGFYVDEIHPPFSGLRFAAMINEAVEFGADAIVVDSGSHEWAGLGGAIDQAADLDPTGKLGAFAWKTPKQRHKRFMNTLLQTPCHVIVTLRGANKLVEGKDRNGKDTLIASPELIPVQEKEFLFDMTLHGIVDDATHETVWVKMPRELRGKVVDGIIERTTGEAIRAWVESGTAVDLALQGEKARLRNAAEEGSFALRTAWAETSKEHKLALKLMLDTELKSIADEADVAIERARVAALLEAGAADTSELPVRQINDDLDDEAPRRTPRSATATAYD